MVALVWVKDIKFYTRKRGRTRLMPGAIRFKDLEVKYQPSVLIRRLTTNIIFFTSQSHAANNLKLT